MSASVAGNFHFKSSFGHGFKALRRSLRYRQYFEVKRHFYASHILLKKRSKGYENFRYEVPTKPGEKKDITCPLPRSYSPEFVEAAWYDWWVEQGLFKPSESDGQGKFIMCLPPPNVTGTLHLGHALTCSIQDAIVRWHRMHGLQTLWIPGSDHAGIATQVVVEKQLWAEEKKYRHNIGREEFLKRVWDWKNSKGNMIFEQMKKMGASLDWSRDVFTMDPKMSRAVTEAFVRLHEEGLIYRSNRLVNWCCHLKSAISDIEVDKIEIEGPTKMSVPGYDKPVTFGEMSLFDYPVKDSDEKITVATTRLETMLGDTAVAVHPEDDRYKHLHNKLICHPFDGRHIPILCDEYVDRAFGTGAVKITPAHDQNDYNLGKKHNLSSINIISDSGAMENVPDIFVGLKRFDARRKVEHLLKEKGLFIERKPHKMVLPVCSRSKDIIEQRLKSQWYVKSDDMARFAVEAVETGKIKLIPGYFRKVWHNFLHEPEDWCISRQIWWGHRIPAYRVLLKSGTEDEEHWVSARDEEEALEKAEQLVGVTREQFTILQDEDVLDTWFSSALFPFSCHGWPDKTEDLVNFYPTQLLETGSDILFFWVARMVMMGYKMTGKLPFNKVLLHGILRDAHGRKMSKSLGNVIDPMDVIHGISLEDLHKKLEASNLDAKELKIAKKGQSKDFPNGIPECGTDALRFGLCSYNFTDDQINVNVAHLQSYRHFCNKIWQGFRYTIDKLDSDYYPPNSLQEISTDNQIDAWILSRLSNLVDECDDCFYNYDLHDATKALHNFWIKDFCDVYLEYTKQVFQSDDIDSITTTKEVLHTCLDTFLRALSPFMPYLCEELYQRLYSEENCESICVAQYPDPEQYMLANGDLEKDVELVCDICSTILSLKQEHGLKKSHITVFVMTNSDVMNTIRGLEPLFNAVAKVTAVSMVTSDDEIPENTISAEVAENLTVHIHDEGRNYEMGLLESGATKVIGTMRFCWSLSYWTSPLLMGILYRRGYFTQEGLASLGRFVMYAGTMYMLAVFCRGIGRWINPDYMEFMTVLVNAQKVFNAENRRLLARYDFEYLASPVHWNWSQVNVGEAKKVKVQTPSRSPPFSILSLPMDILSYMCAHTFGRRMVYPGATALINTLVEGPLCQGRTKLIEERRGLRAKVQTEDGNQIDTMFLDRRHRGTPEGKTLVVCCEGNAGFYEIGAMETPEKLGYSVIGWNHPGFAGSSGVPFPSQEQCAIDAVMQYAIHELGFMPNDIVVYAWSIGGYTASWAAMNYPDVKYMILDATFDEIMPLAYAKMPSFATSLVERTITQYLDLNIVDQVIQYPGPILLIRRTRDEMITTLDPTALHTNRGNFLLKKLLKHRYPYIIDDITIPYFEEWLSKTPPAQGEMWSQYEVDEGWCQAAFQSYVEEQEQIVYPQDIGLEYTDQQKIHMTLFLASRYMENFETVHCTPLPERFFHQPWDPRS